MIKAISDTMRLRPYQVEVSNSLERLAPERISRPVRAYIKIQSPTGSGKTVMMSEGLVRIGGEVVNIWVAPRTLHKQSYEKVQRYTAGRGSIRCLYPDQLTSTGLDPGDTLFINWESMNREGKNLILKENEYRTDLLSILRHARMAGHNIVLWVDEEHNTMRGPQSTRIVDLIDPNLVIGFSATVEGPVDIWVDPQDVIDAGVIRKGWEFNLGLSFADGASNECVIDAAMNKLNEIYVASSKYYNPLLMICLPRKTKIQKDLRERVTAYLKSRWSLTDQQIAIWLSDKHVNLEEISNPFNGVKVLLFKEAAALGWDCPRAQVLVILRDMQEETFFKQTLGRQARTVGLMHYNNNLLDFAYVYTNIEQIVLMRTKALGPYITSSDDYGTRVEEYQDIDLANIHRRRVREDAPLNDPRFVRCFDRAWKKAKCKIDEKKLSVTQGIFGEATVEMGRYDLIGGAAVKMVEAVGAEDIQFHYNRMLKSLVSQSGNIDEDAGVLGSCFARNLGGYGEKTQRVVLCNHAAIAECVSVALTEYHGEFQIAQGHINRSGEKIVHVIKGKKVETDEVMPFWNVPEIIGYPEQPTTRQYKKCALNNIFSLDPKDYGGCDRIGSTRINEPERKFRRFLEFWDFVIWWYQQPDKRESQHFAIPFQSEDGQIHGFYIDFIIRTAKGILIVDVKKGPHNELATGDNLKRKARALQVWLREQKAPRKKLGLPDVDGGIVAQNKDGLWLINRAEDFTFDTNGDDWEPLTDA